MFIWLIDTYTPCCAAPQTSNKYFPSYEQIGPRPCSFPEGDATAMSGFHEYKVPTCEIHLKLIIEAKEPSAFITVLEAFRTDLPSHVN